MNPEQRHAWFCRSLGIFGILLFWSTWKLWTPQTDYPQIPFFEFLINVPGIVDKWAFVAAVFGLLVVTFTITSEPSNKAIQTYGFWGFIASTVVLILLNQHRLQPWAYQLVVFAILIVCTKPKSAFFWMRLIIASIYIYSATSKCDFQFLFTVGDDFLNQFFAKFGLNAQVWNEDVRRSMILGMPLAELCVGIGLAIAPSRKAPPIAALCIHLAIIVLLFGNAAWGVLIWNVFFIVSIIFLFLLEDPKTKTPTEKQSDNKSRQPLEYFAVAIALFVITFPLTRAIDLCDHWPAWELYSPRTSRATLQNTPGSTAVDLAPDPIELLGAPAYPQDRFQLGVCMAVLEKHDLSGFFVVVSGVSDRLSGERKRDILFRHDQMKMRASKYFLNTKPREFYFDGKSNFTPLAPMSPNITPQYPGQKF